MFLSGHLHAEVTSPAMTTLLLEHRSPSPTPIRNVASASHAPSPPSSKALKFGMDRILADDIPSRRKSPDSDYSLQAYEVHSPSSVSSTWSPGRCCGSCEVGGSRVPCSDCVSSLMRCCSVSAPLAPTPHYPYASMHYLPVHHNASHYASLYASPDLMHAAKPSGGSPSVAPTMSAAQSSGSAAAAGGSNKRKRSWSRAVFSNLQRKGLEKRFQLQKYITKPDRRQLAATLGLTDAQVKVWFQNRRMKWRHSKEAKIGVSTGGVPEVASVTSTLVAGRPNVTAEVRVVDLNNRRAADSTQLECPDISPDDDSDVDIEVTA